MLEMYWFQKQAVENTLNCIQHSNGNPLIQAPTGSGKSVIVANLISKWLKIHHEDKIIQLAHQKELIQQNAETYKEWFNGYYGICATELKRKNVNDQVIFGQIQTIINQKQRLGKVGLIIVDEAHWGMSAESTMYNKFISYLKEKNPSLKVIGLTATPFTKNGKSLLNFGLFSNIVYNIAISTLIEEGFLCEPIPLGCLAQADLSGVKASGGDFNLTAMAKAFHENDVTNKALNEVLKFGKNRKKWLIFASNVAHTKEVCEKLNEAGIPSNYIIGDTGKDREKILEDFKNGKYKALVNYGVLTTGVNVKDIDMIAMLRGTKSPGLWIQIVGRGMRTFPGKENCLVLDFGGNIDRFGAIDKLSFRKGEKTEKAAMTVVPVKICRNTNCRASNDANAKKCKYCGTEFITIPKDRIVDIDTSSANGQIISTQSLAPTSVNVDDISFKKHIKKSTKGESLKVTYRNGIKLYSEWLAFGNKNANFKTGPWWRKMGGHDPSPETVDEALSRCSLELGCPRAIKVRKNGKYEEIIGYDI